MEAINKSFLNAGINLSMFGRRLFDRKSMQDASSIQLSQWVKDFLPPEKKATSPSEPYVQGWEASSTTNSQAPFFNCPEAPIYLRQFVGMEAC
ncbi:MAG: hypothetical protein AAGA85_20195 [Bacteroidota bacterium]